MSATALIEREFLPSETFFRTLSDQTQMRIVKIISPYTNQPVTAIPYLDFAKALSYDEESIRQMIYRSKWLKNHSITCIIQAVDGKFRAQLCLLEEAVLGIFMKLEPGRCKNPDIGAHIDQRQEELIYLLKSALQAQQTMTVDHYKSIRLAADLIPRISKCDDPDLKEILYQQLEATLGCSVPRPVKRLPLFDKPAA